MSARLAMVLCAFAASAFSFEPRIVRTPSRTFNADANDSSSTTPSTPLTAEILDALPTLDDLVASGKAKVELFRGNSVSSRFHFATRALNGDFSKDISPEADTEREGSIESALMHFPASCSITVVGKLSVNADFVAEVKQRIEATVITTGGDPACGSAVELKAVPRNGGES